MEEKQETKSENGIRNFPSRIRKSALDLIAGIKRNRQEAEPEYGIEHETGKEERKGKGGSHIKFIKILLQKRQLDNKI